MALSDADEILRQKSLGSLLTFTKLFFYERTKHDFQLSQPICRESHYLTISRELTKVQRGETQYLLINCPPRYGKSEMLIHFVAWCMAKYPDSNFIYVSYSHTLAAKQTQAIREIITLPAYRHLYGVELRSDSKAKDNFETTHGGTVYAAGITGTITGHGAGIKHCNRFGGCIVIDDSIKPDDAFSEVVRERTNSQYKNTVVNRTNDPMKTPIIFIGQRTHEDDLPANLIKSFDGHEWKQVILPAIDNAGNALCPTMHTVEDLRVMEEVSPYEFAAQYQQNPQPAGGGIFKPEWFKTLDEEPQMIATFIVGDAAETDKTYNDATALSFFGLYKIIVKGVETGAYGLHWLDCLEERVEPKDLEALFLDFYACCMRHPVKPKIAAIEKKSTGTTLASLFKSMQGLRIIEIERNANSGNKVMRFMRAQPYVGAKLVTFPAIAKHRERCIEHMRKITLNNSHRFDDIADTLADGVQLALIDQVIMPLHADNSAQDRVLSAMAVKMKRDSMLRQDLWRR